MMNQRNSILRCGLILFLALSAKCWDCPQAAERLMPAAGFYLAPDHGLVYSATRGGGLVKGAKILGSPGYQAFMRRNISAVYDEPVDCNQGNFATRLISNPLGGGSCKSHIEEQGVLEMLQALKKASEDSIDDKICFAVITLHNVSQDYPHLYSLNMSAQLYKRRLLNRVLRSIGLRLPGTKYHTPPKYAILANNYHFIGWKTGIWKKAVLAIDVSLTHTDVSILAESYATLPVRESFLPRLGHDDTDAFWKTFEDNLIATIRPPWEKHLEEDELTPPEVIEKIYLYGDDIQNMRFREILERLFSKRLLEDPPSHDPEWIVAMGAAIAAWDVVSNDWDIPAHPGCLEATFRTSSDEL